MNLHAFFEKLSYGELSNLYMGINGEGTIQDKDKARILSFIQEGLLMLYSKFLLKESSLILESFDHITQYHLLKRFSKSRQAETGEKYAYILDKDGERFNEDVIKVMGVYDHYGRSRPLNDLENQLSVMTPQTRTIELPDPQNGHIWIVTYQANHPVLNLDDDSEEIVLPSILIPALSAYVGYLAHTYMGTPEATAKGQEYLMRYADIVQTAENQDLVNSSISQSHLRFYRRGWI